MYPNDRKYSKEHEWAKQDINVLDFDFSKTLNVYSTNDSV